MMFALGRSRVLNSNHAIKNQKKVRQLVDLAGHILKMRIVADDCGELN